MSVECILLKNPKYGDFHLLLDEGVPMFNCMEIAKIFCYRYPYEATITCVNTNDRFKRIIANFPKSAEDTWFMNMRGLYSLALRSDCGVDEDFIKWITEEVSFRTDKSSSCVEYRSSCGARIVDKSQKLSLSEQKPQEDEIQDLKREVGELKEIVLKIKEQLELFTLPEVKTSEKSQILAIKEMVKKYQRLTGCEYTEVWNKAYKDLYYKYGISVNGIREAKKGESKLSKLARKGHLEELKIILSEMIRDGGVN
jgi:hypothetical protein|nr:MAG TPA: BRO family protein [Caudoviricetes sp.]